jgi:hypothetical protein
VARIALQNIAVNRLRLHVVQLGRHMMRLPIRGWAGQPRAASSVQTALGAVDVSHRAVLKGRRNVTSTCAGSAVMKAHALVTDSHVGQSLLVIVTSTATTAATAAASASATAEVVHLFALQFVLNTFTVRSVPNERKNGTNAFDKQSALIRLSII